MIHLMIFFFLYNEFMQLITRYDGTGITLMKTIEKVKFLLILIKFII